MQLVQKEPFVLKKLTASILHYKYIYLLILPGLVFYAIFMYGPMYGIQLAFKEYIVSKGIWGSPFIGFDNFKYIIYDSDFWYAFRNTIIISICKLIFVFPAPIIIALALNELVDGTYKRILQTVFTFPHFLSWIVVSGIILNIFGANGAINNLLDMMGLEKQAFLASPQLFRPLLYFTDIWKESGWSCIIYLAAITSINPEIYEAAIVDGVNRWQKMRFITLPGIHSTIVILFILSIGNLMNAGFDQVFNLYNPVVYDVGDIIDTYIYRITFQNSNDLGFSTAVGLFKSIINLVLLLSANKLAKKSTGSGIF